MFDFLSWGHLLVIGLAALFIFGPERLPTLAADAGRGLRRLREAIAGVRDQMTAELGEDLPDLRELDVRRYHPRVFLRTQLLGDDENRAVQADRSPGSSASTASAPTASEPAAFEPAQHQRALGADFGGPAVARVLPPPFDVDAT